MNVTGTEGAKYDKSQYCLELKNVGKSFEGLRAIDNVNLSVCSGERLAIIGPNGAGKTTLFNMISGALPVTDGEILLFGENVTSMSNNKRVHKGLARTYQITSLFWDYSILENTIIAIMALSRRKFSMFRRLIDNTEWFEEADELLKKFNLYDKRNEAIKNLSYGDERLMEIVLALASKPRLLCLDEPNAGMSIAESRVMIDIIQKLSKDITLLLIEHDMDMVFEIVDRIMVLQDGIVIAVDTKENVRNNRRVQQIYLGDAQDA